MSIRRFGFLVVIALADYALWKWSLNRNHDVLALISGLALTPLVVGSIWLLVLGLMRTLAGRARSPQQRSAGVQRARAQALQRAAQAAPVQADGGAQTAAARPDPRKLAA